VKFDAAELKWLCLRWIVRPIAFVAPLALVAGWSGILPSWKISALLAFCMFWADTVGLFGKPRPAVTAPATPAGRRRPPRPWRRWDFEDYEVIFAAVFGFISRAFWFVLPVVLVAWWADAPMGWKLVALILFTVIWERVTDRIGAQD
jgi:hypothetical protein